MESDGDDHDSVPVSFNFPPKGADHFVPLSHLAEVSPLREDLSVDGINLGASKEKILEFLGEPTDIEVDEDDGSEWWTYEGPYGFHSRPFCLSADESWSKTRRTLELCFIDGRACLVSGGTLKMSDNVVFQAGTVIDERIFQLGNPVTENKPLPPYFQYIRWESTDWVIWIESERAAIRVRLLEPWWPPQEDEEPEPL